MITGTLTLTEATCAHCGTHFAIDAFLQRQFRENAITFYCPNGHKLWYEISKADELKKENQNLRNRVAWAETEAEQAKKEKTALKGQLTKTRKRIANGVCPCCHRTFKQLAAHMDNKHPDFKAAVA